MSLSKRVYFKLAGVAAALAIGATASFSALAVGITGAGATFPFAVYSKWAESYQAATGNKVNYQAYRLVGWRQADEVQDRRFRRF